ncbi:hypothetical protein QFZ89_008020 [Paraburkholderia youngii]
MTVCPSLLDLTRQFSNLRALLLVGRRHMHREQLSQRVHRHMYLAAFLAFVSVVACACAAFAGRLQRTAIEDDRAGLTTAVLGDPEDRTQIAHHVNIPRQIEREFHAKANMNSTANRTPIPRQNEQGFHAKANSKVL